MHLGIAVINGGFTSGVASVVDILRTANGLRSEIDPMIAPFDIEILGGSGRRNDQITTDTGFVLPTTGPLSRLGECDIALVAAFGQLDAAALLARLNSREGTELLGELAGLPDRMPVAAACTGTFALAEAGLLDGREATTSWWLSADFRARYPRAVLNMDAMVVEDDRCATAGAAFGHIDLALALVRRVSLELATVTARFLLLDQRSNQSEYVAISHLARRDELVSRFERQVRAHLDQPFDVAVVAAGLGASRRTLERRVTAAVGMSPLQVVQRLRVERARHLLASTDRSVEDVARDVGYLNAASLRALMRRFPASGSWSTQG